MDLETARFLTSEAGERLLETARETREEAPHRRVARLRREVSVELGREVLVQDDLRRRAVPRCPHAETLLFTPGALEQATAWPVAVERAARWPGDPDAEVADLTAGIGFDALATALAGRPVLAYERDPARAHLLERNAEALGVGSRLRVRVEDVVEAAPTGRLAFLDPDRRPGGRRTRRPEAFEPQRALWDGLLGGFEAAMVKLPPVTAGEIGEETPFEVVSLAGRVRERRLFRGDFGALPPRRALSLPAGASVEGVGAPWPSPRAPAEGDWLLDVDPAVTVSGLVGDLAVGSGLAPVNAQIAYLLGQERLMSAPGCWVRIEAVLRPRAREMNAWLEAAGVGRLTIRTRGVADDAETWRKRLRPRGPRAGTLVLTRAPDGRWVALAGHEDPVTPE